MTIITCLGLIFWGLDRYRICCSGIRKPGRSRQAAAHGSVEFDANEVDSILIRSFLLLVVVGGGPTGIELVCSKSYSNEVLFPLT